MLDNNDTASPYFMVTGGAGGWLPIGNTSTPFTATFEGNGFVIRNLAIRRNQLNIGLFGATTGTIRNLGLEQALADHSGSMNTTYVGGLVGLQQQGAIIACYATGAADGGAGTSDNVGGLVGYQEQGTITASYATGNADGGAGRSDSVGGLVGWQQQGTITASYATGTAKGGAGDNDRVGGLVGYQGDPGTVTASYATGDVDGGDGDNDSAGALLGRAATHAASYGFGSSTGGETGTLTVDRSQDTAATRAVALTAGAAAVDNTNAGVAWNVATRGTLNAWDFGDSNQPPALLYNDYDGSSRANDIDYCALFAAANTPCGTLIPGQRATTTPQFGTHTGDIQMAQGDTTRSVTASILLPASLTVDGTSLDLTWSVQRDPADNPVTIDAGDPVIVGDETLLIDADRRASTRWIILRAMSGSALVNDYRLRIIAGSEGLQNPALRFTAPVDTLEADNAHSFIATSDSSGAITYDVTDTAGNATSLASIATNGMLSATTPGTVLVTATVEADSDYRAATTQHTVTIPRHPANLTFTAEPGRLQTGSDQTAQFSATREGEGAITWGIVEDAPAAMISGSGLVTAGNTAETITVQAVVAQTPTHASEAITATLEIANFVDFDENGLIEIYDLTMLHNMRHDLAGSSYKTSNGDTGSTTGCPMPDGCNGYELMNDLDFDTNGDGTWTESGGTYTLDRDDTQATYFDTASGGWLPIGTGTGSNAFSAIFEGNGFVIRNLAISRNQTHIGLFGYTTGTLRNVGLEGALADYSGNDNGNIHIGTLVGYMERGTIHASYATGAADGGDGNFDRVGGLVGSQVSGTIRASHAGVAAEGGPGTADRVGGLVGTQGGNIIASHATGTANGGDGNGDDVGGLVGRQNRNSIRASYATGAANGGNGNDTVGGLVGIQLGLDGNTLTGSNIHASYATGTADGGMGNDDVGGLVGWQGSEVLASYATGAASGGIGDDDVGGLVGHQQGVSIIASYATGAVDGGMDGNDNVGRLVGRQLSASGVNNDLQVSYGFSDPTNGRPNGHGSPPAAATTAAALTQGNAGGQWNTRTGDSLNIWAFGDSNQPPALRYNDYDGNGSGFDYCASFTTANTRCGALIPGQRSTTTPQFGSGAGAIQLTDGDTPRSVTGSITLPASIMVGGNTINLTWSVFHDPETVPANRVTFGSGQLIVNAANRLSTRQVILRANSGSTIINDYTLRIIQNP